MKIEEVAMRVASIAEQAGDDEAQHCEQDALYLAVLTAIAHGAGNARGLANAALVADRIPFSRWCA